MAATATIHGKQVEVRSAELASPRFVRMGWQNTATPTLRDANGWPVPAFPAKPVE